MRSFTKKLALLPLIFMCDFTFQPTHNQIVEAYADYNSDLDTLDLIEPDYATDTNFQNLHDDIPYIFMPILTGLADTYSAKNEKLFISKVRLLNKCVAQLAELSLDDFPASCTQLKKGITPDESLLQEEDMQEDEISKE